MPSLTWKRSIWGDWRKNQLLFFPETAAKASNLFGTSWGFKDSHCFLRQNSRIPSTLVDLVIVYSSWPLNLVLQSSVSVGVLTCDFPDSLPMNTLWPTVATDWRADHFDYDNHDVILSEGVVMMTGRRRRQWMLPLYMYSRSLRITTVSWLNTDLEVFVRDILVRCPGSWPMQISRWHAMTG